jgi:hypothetical protein
MAKAACAADAIAEGILDFIMFGNGQTAPAEKRLFEPQEDDATSAPPPVTLTLQGFFEALPRPLPEPVDDKTVAEINAPGWLNTLIQSARGGKFEHKFIWTTDTKLGSMSYSFPPLFAFKAVYDSCIAHQLFPWISPRRRSATYSPWRGPHVYGRTPIPKARGCKECSVPCGTRCGCWRVRACHQRGTRSEDIPRDEDPCL